MNVVAREPHVAFNVVVVAAAAVVIIIIIIIIIIIKWPVKPSVS